ncbi:MAG: hypothetical protein L3K08_03745, partial [Thermoplasmata archaeon]|nr:hypothetical protein [Thermoplasmata archaeon]
ILGGSAPYQIAWSINGLNVTGANSNSLVWIPAKPGNVTAIAWVTDAANLTVSSAPLTASGGSPTRSNGSPSTASTPAPDETGWYVAAVVAAGAVAMLILVLVLLQSPRRPPRVGGRSNPRGRPANRARSPPP